MKTAPENSGPKPQPKNRAAPASATGSCSGTGSVGEKAFAIAFGLFLGVALLKFGNPPITERFISPPADIFELVLGYPWPISWAYLVLGLLIIAGFRFMLRPVPAPKWLLALPVAWVLWQWVATSESTDLNLSRPTFWHLAACGACFFVGLSILSRRRSLYGFLAGILAGFLLVLIEGWQQRFGGLDAVRKYFWESVYPTLANVPPEYIKKMSSNRIWATLFYPNALAGALLLVLPTSLVCTWLAGGKGRMTSSARILLVGIAAVAGLACLFWSGSKGGWLLMLLLGVVALLHLRLARRLKLAIVGLVLLAGISGFFVKYSSFFAKGATSVSARFDYWRAAFQTVQERPWVGSGPGTFARAYAAVKQPDSEMARLVHNDYLEQASDSGWPGFLAYSAFIFSSLWLAYPRRDVPVPGEQWLVAFALWLGVLGWALQGFLEFGLYLPALAWPAFTFLGLLVGRNRLNQVDNPKAPL